MPIEILLATALALWALIPLARAALPDAGALVATVVVVAGCTVLAWGAWAWWLPAVAPVPPPDRPLEILRDGYVSSGACRACHPRNYDTWHDSWHRTMTQVAHPDRVLGDFDSALVEVHGRRYGLHREGDDLWADLPREDGGRERVRVVLTTGSHHMQVYWYPAGNGRMLDQLPLVWLKEASRWVPRNAAFVRPPEDAAPHEAGRWNATCIQCHTTRGRPRLLNLSALSLRAGVDSEAAELGIACEACHGPGEAHVAANRDPLRRYRLHLTEQPDPTIVNPTRLPPRRSAQVCGQCHSVFTAGDEARRVIALDDGHDFRPGEDLEASRRIVRRGHGTGEAPWAGATEEERELVPASFWPDGVVRVSGREYNALTASPCFAHGDEAKGMITCLTCHRLHQAADDLRSPAEWADDQLEQGMRTDRACLGCHERFREARVRRDHTRHPEGSAGALCYNCHMPPTTYGLLKAMRDHTIASPSARTPLESGRPDPCTLCHLDRPLGWAADWLERWYGQPPPELDEVRRRVPESVVAALAGDAGARVLAAWAMGWAPALEASGTGWQLPILGVLLDDPYDAVRYVATRSASRHPGADLSEYDFLSPAGERGPLAHGVRTGDGTPPGSPVIDESTRARLLARRDHRPVLLAE